MVVSTQCNGEIVEIFDCVVQSRAIDGPRNGDGNILRCIKRSYISHNVNGVLMKLFDIGVASLGKCIYLLLLLLLFNQVCKGKCI
jgi:hypothetical protein